MKEKILCHFNFLKGDEEDINKFFDGLVSEKKFLYRVYPSRSEYDFLIWTVKSIEDSETVFNFMRDYYESFKDFKDKLKSELLLWGYTKPSIYTKGKSPQEIDVFSERKKYLIIYPFIKTPEWYLLSMDTRQGMMNEHIRIGRKYPEIKQLLLYSFGIQDQEFIVVYETEDIINFSELVFDLRGSEVRKYTLRDTPITVGFLIR
ncbi:MAG: chlorite dismutase family protein [candidate division WOR-3 bacterium]